MLRCFFFLPDIKISYPNVLMSRTRRFVSNIMTKKSYKAATFSLCNTLNIHTNLQRIELLKDHFFLCFCFLCGYCNMFVMYCMSTRCIVC